MPDALTALKEKFPQATDRPSLDHPAVNVPIAELVGVLRHLRDEAGFDLLMDVTAIDWAEGRIAAVHRGLSSAFDDANGNVHPRRGKLPQ
jgi:NADH:ubiquinone oxidoreductase subunit C